MEFDYLVLGGGSGGIASARRAASYGAKVALIESGSLGGTCVNVGCVPKKVMWNGAQVLEALHHASGYGISCQLESYSFSRLKESRDNYVQKLNKIYDTMLENSGVSVFRGFGEFVSCDTIRVGEQNLKAKHVLIATGGKPLVPNIPGASLGHTSDGFFGLENLPSSAVVIGSGYIGVEIAGVLNALGTKVTLVCRKDHALSGFGKDIGSWITNAMEKSGIAVKRLSNVKSIGLGEDAGEQKIVCFDDGSSVAAQEVFWAIGRKPNTSNIGLERAGISENSGGFNPDGSIWVDEYQNTKSKAVYAVGDVIGKVDLTPVAIAAGRKLASRLFDGKPDAKIDYDNIASVVFSHPPLGSVGHTEESAVVTYGPKAVKVYRSEFTNMYYSPLKEELKQRTYMKLICLGDTEKVIGIQIAGRGADEMIQGFAVTVKMGATKHDFDETMAIHPTASEELVTMT